MKIVLIADLHLNSRDPHGKYITLKDGSKINSRLNDKLKHLYDAVYLTIKNGCKMFILCGDTFDKPHPTKELRKLFLQTIRPLFKENIAVVFILGNHEISQSGSHPFQDVVELDTNNFYLIDKTTQLGKMITLVPWGCSEWPNYRSKYMFGHMAVIGEVMNNGISCNEGIKKSKLYDNFQQVKLGHFHKASDIYIGSLARRSFHEKHSTNGFLILDTVNDSFERINVKDRKFIQIKIDEDNPHFDNSVCSDEDIVMVKIKGSRDFVESIKLDLDKIKCHTLHIPQPIFTDRINDFEQNISVISIEDSIESYCKEKGANEEYARVGVNLYRKAYE